MPTSNTSKMSRSKTSKAGSSASSTKTAQSKSWCRRTFHSLSASAAIEARLKVASRCHCKELKPQTAHWRQLRLRCAPKDDESGAQIHPRSPTTPSSSEPRPVHERFFTIEFFH